MIKMDTVVYPLLAGYTLLDSSDGAPLRFQGKPQHVVAISDMHMECAYLMLFDQEHLITLRCVIDTRHRTVTADRNGAIYTVPDEAPNMSIRDRWLTAQNKSMLVSFRSGAIHADICSDSLIVAAKKLAALRGGMIYTSTNSAMLYA